MLTRATLRTLAELRLAEAQLLLERGFFSGAYYLAGYAAELGLKALIATKFAAHEIPDRDFVNRVYTHDIEKLIDHAGLKPEFDQRVKNDFPFRNQLGNSEELE